MLVDHAVQPRPQLTAATRVHFVDGHTPVRVDFHGDVRRREGAPKAPGIIAGGARRPYAPVKA
jgi:hypothetical protein